MEIESEDNSNSLEENKMELKEKNKISYEIAKKPIAKTNNSKKIKNKGNKGNLSQTKYKKNKKKTKKNKSVDKINNSSQYIEEKLNANNDIDDNIDYDKEIENEPIIYHLINNKGDIYLYTIKSKTNN